MNAMKPKSVLVHGRAVNCVEAGSGPVLLLIHGMAGNIGNWQEVIGPLARHHTDARQWRARFRSAADGV